MAEVVELRPRGAQRDVTLRMSERDLRRLVEIILRFTLSAGGLPGASRPSDVTEAIALVTGALESPSPWLVADLLGQNEAILAEVGALQ